ncbi:MAG: hypothetical protein H8D32_06930 [Dehalococcoidia bacterium]|nr:hypothetical protein [Dehalococcoidia bacterium]
MMRKRWILAVIILLLASWPTSLSYGAELPSSIELTIPGYTVTSVGGLDYVEIPGGEVLLAEEGRPRVPYYIRSIDYPKGYRVQDVILEERSGLETATGLRLPVVILDPSPELPIEMKEGWYPEEEYDWSQWENPDGSTTLIIVMYPFYYDPETTDVKFYKNYCFDIEYVISSVSITGLTIAKETYEPGDKVPIDMWLHNSGETQDVIVNTVIKQYGSDETEAGLPLRSLRSLVGDASVTAEWDTSGIEPGYYYAEVALADTAGNVLDKKTVGVPIQVSEAPERPTKFPTLYLIIGGVVVAAIVASVLVIKSRKKA